MAKIEKILGIRILLKISGIVILLIVCLIPFWLVIGGSELLSPESFFQKFFVLGIGVYPLGVAQVILLVAWVSISRRIWLKL